MGSAAVPRRPMRRADLTAVGRVLSIAFEDDPFYVVLFPDRAERARILPAYFERSAKSALELGAAWVIETPEQPVAGAALWALPVEADPPGADPVPATPVRDPALADLFGGATFETYAAAMDHLRRSRLASVASPHGYLNLVGVHPSVHGRGFGRSLVGPTLERADREGWTTALETFSEANLALYARLGFGVRHAGSEPHTGLRWWLLTRPPRGAEPLRQDPDVRVRSAASKTRASDSE